MQQSLGKLLVNLTVVAMIALVTISCGRRGNLEAPPTSTDIVAGEENQEDTSSSNTEDKPFILDALL